MDLKTSDVEGLTAILEELLSRDAILRKRDSFITALIAFWASPLPTVPVTELLNHPRLAHATEEAVLEAAEKSSVVTVDRTRNVIMPELKAKRNTLILRETPARTTQEDILKLLSRCPELIVTLPRPEASVGALDPKKCCSSLVTMSSDRDSWFLTFKDEETAVSVAWWLRQQELGGSPVQVRIKTETAVHVDHLLSSMVSPPRPSRTSISRRWHGGGNDRSRKFNYDYTDPHPTSSEVNDKRATGNTSTTKLWRRNGHRSPGRRFNRPTRVPEGARHKSLSRRRVALLPRSKHESQEKIVVVTPSEFPPLCDAIPLTPTTVYRRTDLRQHTMEEVRSICEQLDLTTLGIPGAMSVQATKDYELAAIIAQQPRQHEWCFHALNNHRGASRGRARLPQQTELYIETLETDGIVEDPLVEAEMLSQQAQARKFWAALQPQSRGKGVETAAVSSEDVQLPAYCGETLKQNGKAHAGTCLKFHMVKFGTLPEAVATVVKP